MDKLPQSILDKIREANECYKKAIRLENEVDSWVRETTGYNYGHSPFERLEDYGELEADDVLDAVNRNL